MCFWHVGLNSINPADRQEIIASQIIFIHRAWVVVQDSIIVVFANHSEADRLGRLRHGLPRPARVTCVKRIG
jgi:hypothetical protein